MKGINTLNLNQATVIEALQEYLNAQLRSEAIKVIDISHLDNTLLVIIESIPPVLSNTPIKEIRV